jgi:hypothetical protein
MSRRHNSVATATALSLFCFAAGGESRALDIDYISFEASAVRIQGQATPPKFDFSVEVVASMLTDVTLTPPGGSPIPVPCTGGSCEFEQDNLTSLSSYPLGSYLFQFNGGASSITLDRTSLMPVDTSGTNPLFADIVSPLHGGTTSTTPVIEWMCGTCDADFLELNLKDLTDATKPLDEDISPPSDGTIVAGMPGSLLPQELHVGHDYELNIELENRNGPGGVFIDDLGGFRYSDDFSNQSIVLFEAVPEPTTTPLLTLGLVGIAARRRRTAAARR